MLIRPFTAALALLLPLAAPSAAHEFWIDPLAFTVPSGETIEADLRNGEGFEGSAFTYNPRRFRRFDFVLDGATTAVEGRPGDRPAARIEAPEDGLHVIVHETTDQKITYKDFAKFEAFLKHKDWPQLAAEHRARGLPEESFVERYSRYAKALVAVGDGAGADAPVGLQTEIVALANPYVEGLREMPVQVLLDGAPRAGAQVELFARAPDGAVAVSLHKADDQGVARLPVLPGHAYLADAVVIRAIEPEQAGAPVWESLWAALTFAVP
ncbi:DUF4198 domain-containing protein [Roseobacteraceae bacterium S113]